MLWSIFHIPAAYACIDKSTKRISKNNWADRGILDQIPIVHDRNLGDCVYLILPVYFGRESPAIGPFCLVSMLIVNM